VRGKIREKKKTTNGRKALIRERLFPPVVVFVFVVLLFL